MLINSQLPDIRPEFSKVQLFACGGTCKSGGISGPSAACVEILSGAAAKRRESLNNFQFKFV
jgi:hypothetical protein